MVTNIKVIIVLIERMDMENSSGPMEMFTKDNLAKI